jgi:hypothetical protein
MFAQKVQAKGEAGISLLLSFLLSSWSFPPAHSHVLLLMPGSTGLLYYFSKLPFEFCGQIIAQLVLREEK